MKSFVKKALTICITLMCMLVVFISSTVAVSADDDNNVALMRISTDGYNGWSMNWYWFKNNADFVKEMDSSLDVTQVLFIIDIYEDVVAPLPNLSGYSTQVEINLHGHTWTVTGDNTVNTTRGLRIEGKESGTTKNGKMVFKENVSHPFYLHASGLDSIADVNNVDFEGRFDTNGLFYADDCSKASINFVNCSFNSTAKYGAVVYAANINKVSFDKCVFNSCSAYEGGIAYLDCVSAVDIINSTATSISGTYGGAFYLDDYDKIKINADSSFFKGCVADYGSIIYSDAESVEIFNLNCDSCYANECGGVLYLNDDNNHVENLIANNCYASADYGGVVYSNGENTYLIGLDCDACYANYGGAVYLETEDNHIENSTFKNCYSTKDGGAIYSNNDYNVVLGSTFISNHGRYGGAIYSNASDISDAAAFRILDSVFDKNYANNSVGSTIYAVDNVECKYYNGTAYPASKVYSKDGSESVYFDDCTIENIVFSDSTLTGSLLSTGNIAIIIAGVVLLAGVLTFIILSKKKTQTA